MRPGARNSLSAKQVFLEATRIAGKAARRLYVEQACNGDQRLLQRVDALLAARISQRDNPLDVAVEQLGGIGLPASDRGLFEPLDLSRHPMIGPYKLLELLGQGGMGAVYRARQTEPVQREVAVKVVRPGMDSTEVLRRFAAERQALAVMDHPHIAQIFDAGRTDTGQPYFVMELVRGMPIDAYCEQHQVPLRKRLKLFIDLCRAVQHAHQNGILHRDLKPSNILVASHDGIPVVKVIDFGIAKALDWELTEETMFTRFAQMIGTPPYMSPEQAEMSGRPLDTRSDIYSLGVLLYQLLTGTTPFASDTLRAAGFDGMRRMICEQDPPPPSARLSTLQATDTAPGGVGRQSSRRLRSELRGELDWIVMKALEKDRDRRYGSASEFAEDVRRFLVDEPVLACPPSVVYRGRKALRRYRIAVLITSVVAAALLITTGISIWQMLAVQRAWQASVEREREVGELLEAATLQAAVQAFREGDLQRLATDLEPLTGRSSTRTGDRETQSSLVQLLEHAARPRPLRTFRHPAAIHEMATTPDGRHLVTVAADNLVRWWDVRKDASPLVLGRHPDEVAAVAISPDGTTAATGSVSGKVFFWDLDKKELIKKQWLTPTGVETIVWSPDGEYIAVGARYSEVVVLDASYNRLHHIPNDQRHESLLFSHDSRKLYVPTRQDIDVWDMKTGKRIKSVSVSPLKNVRAMCWAGPQGKWLLAGDRFLEMLTVVEPNSGKRRRTVAVGESYVQSLAALGDRTWVVAAFPNGRLQVLSITDGFEGKVAAGVQLDFTRDPQEKARSVVCDVPGQPFLFLSGGADGQVHLWQRTAIKPFTVAETKRAMRYGCLLSNGRLVLYQRGTQGNLANRPRIWGERDEPPQRHGNKAGFEILANSLSVHDVVAATGEYRVALVKLPSGEVLSEAKTPFEYSDDLELSPDGKRVAARLIDEVMVWQVDERTYRLRRLGKWEFPELESIRFTDGGATLLLGGKQQLSELDLARGRVVRRHVTDGRVPIAVSDDGRLLAAERETGVQVWQRDSGRVVFDVPDTSEVSTLTFSPDGRLLITGQKDETVRAWHLPTGQPIGMLYKPLLPMGTPDRLQWSADGNRLLIWFADQSRVRFVVLGTRSR